MLANKIFVIGKLGKRMGVNETWQLEYLKPEMLLNRTVAK